jgi:hypothetical protein
VELLGPAACGSEPEPEPGARRGCRNEGQLPSGAVKKKMTKATYICRSTKKKAVTYFILFLFLFFIVFL